MSAVRDSRAEAKMTQPADKEAPSRKKRKHVCIYGNYKNYYGYRVDRKLAEDPRLQLLKKEWFEGKDCLDIGCNQGLITISIAKKFSCRRIVGVDIDPGLIEAAHWNLRRTAKAECPDSRLMKTSDPLISKDDHALEHNLSKSSGKDKVNSPRKVPHLEEGTLLQRVSFRTDNFVENFRGCIEKYDTVICLSVTKWIHLNWGDDGLVTLFAKIWRLLRQGGILLLEPQSWSSYRSNRLVSEIAKLNFNNIMFTPDLFQEILLDKIGFRSMMDVSGPLSGTVAGFHRPIFLFQK